MGSWLLKLLSRHENKNKNNKWSLKKYRKIKALRNIKPTMDHYPRNGLMLDTDP